MADTGAIWSDRFRDWDHVYGRRGVALLREPAPVPAAPHMRVSPADPSYGVPAGGSLREFARSEGIDVSSPHFREPETRNIRSGFFPLLRALQDGSLLTVWREASAHAFCSFGRTVAARSTDGGRSWSEPWVIFTLPDDAVDAGGPEDLVQTGDGTLWMGAWSRVRGRQPGTQGHQIATAYALYSQDDGRTWVTLPPLGDHFYPASPELAMSNGEFLWRGSVPAPAEAGLTSHPASVRATLVLRDADAELARDADVAELGGLRFERFAHPHLGGPDEEQVTETLIPGTLVMLMRSQGYGEHYFQTTSTDYGRTWSAAVPSLWHSPVPSQPYLITLTDGTLVAVNGQRQNCRIVATASFDNGATWDVAHQQVVLDDQRFLGADFAYPQLTEVADGRLLSIYYSHDHRDETGERSGIFGTFLETRFFRPAYRGVELTEVGAVRRDSTVAHWRFDEGAGSVAADDGGPHYAKLAGPAWVPGKRGTALRFDGRDDYGYVLECPELRIAREFTVEAWISTEAPQRTQTIVSKLPHYWIGLHQGRLCLRRGGVGGIPLLENLATTALEADRWYHVAVAVRITLDWYERVLFYVDGEVDANENLALPASAEQAAAISDWHESSGPRWQAHHQRPSRHEDIGEQADAIRAAEDHLYIGLQHDRRTAPFAGLIDELALHGSGLLPRDVQASSAVHRRADGEVSSGVIPRPATGWGRFGAEVRTPEGTAIEFSVAAPDGTVLRSGVSPGDSLADLDAPELRLAARLTSSDPGRTPVLRSWSLHGSAAG
jgi:hypothetical protein